MRSRAVVLLNLGGPDSLEAIEPFLANLFADPATIPLPWWLKPFQPQLARFVARKRAPKVRGLYELIGGRSPIVENTTAQAQALEAEFARRGEAISVHVAMQAWHPMADQVVRDLAGKHEVLLLPLYPQASSATSFGHQKHFRARARAAGATFSLHDAPSYHVEPAYLDAMVETLHEGLLRFEDPRAVSVLFSAHSLPMVIVDKGDPYPAEIAATRRAIEEKLGHAGPVHLAFQSQTGGVKWLGPTVHETLDRLAAEGTRDLLFVPLGFVSDHLETLYEMDILYAEHARRLGMNFVRSASLGDRPRFIQALADVALRAFSGTLSEPVFGGH